MSQPLVLVVGLWVVPSERRAFEAFEREAAALMARHGGRIERVVRVRGSEGGDDDPDEVHVVSFPDAEAFERYGADPEVRARAEARDRVIARTRIVAGVDARPYAAGAPPRADGAPGAG